MVVAGRGRFWEPARPMRLWQFPYSTNVERVQLALAHKGLHAEPVVVDPADRAPVHAVSGQPLVPVLEAAGRILTESMDIVAWLEAEVPDPPLYPADPARRAEMQVFIDWFDGVWKGPPNRIADRAALPGDVVALRGSLDRFEMMLQGRDHLMDEEFSAADVAAFPFLKYGWIHDPADDEPFHLVLAEHLALEPRHERLRDWIERVDARPRSGVTAGVSDP